MKCVKRAVNRFKKETIVNVHKVFYSCENALKTNLTVSHAKTC